MPDAIIRKVNPYELHGVQYYQLFLSLANQPDMVREVRLSHDAVYKDPADGDEVEVQMILSMITDVKKKG
jgi:hypothetical protein